MTGIARESPAETPAAPAPRTAGRRAPAPVPAGRTPVRPPPPPDDHLAETLAEVVSGPPVGPGIDELVTELIAAIPKRDNALVHLRLKFEADRIDQIVRHYAKRTGKDLRRSLVLANWRIDGDRPDAFVRALAVLHGGADAEYEPWAQMGLALIPPMTRDSDLIRLLEERNERRRRPQLATLRREYEAAFAGIHKTPNDTLAEHIVDDTTGHTRQKALAILDHELTDADHLSFVTTAITSAHDVTALEILQRVWEQGRFAGFRTLHEDWERFVRGPGFTPLHLYEAMDDEMSGVHWKAAKAIFEAYYDKDGGADRHAAEAAGDVEEKTIRAGLAAGIFTSNGAIVAGAAARLRKEWEQRIAVDPWLRSVWETKRARLDTTFRERAGLRNEDEIEARIGLLREPTLVDQMWLAAARRDYDRVTALAGRAWEAGIEETIEAGLRNPPAGDPRPALVGYLIPRSDSGLYDALTNLGLSHAERGAVRLDFALNTRSARTTSAADLETTYRQLKGMKPAVRASVIDAYVARFFKRGAPGYGKSAIVEPESGEGMAPAVRFCLAVTHPANGFEQSATMVDLKHLLVPGQSLQEVAREATARDRASHTGVADGFTTGMVLLYDAVSGEDVTAVADDALARLRSWVRKEHAEPDQLAAVMKAEGVTSVTELADLGYERFKARLDEFRDVKATAAETIGMVVDFAGRSLLVAVLGPAGLPGLISALGAYGGGMLAREAMQGVDYQTQSVQNLSTLIAEVATFGFDELGFEKVIKDLVPGRTLAAAAGSAQSTVPEIIARKAGLLERALGPDGLSDRQAKFLQDMLKQGGAKFFEKAAQNMVEGKGFPTTNELLARTAHALAASGFKTLADKVLAKPDVFTPAMERFQNTLKRTIINGPPPKAALGYALTKELTDMYASPDWDNTTWADKLTRLTKTGLISVASAVPVAVAFTHLGVKEQTRATRLAARNPDLFYASLQKDPTLALAYQDHVRLAQRLKAPKVPSFTQWVQGHHAHQATARPAMQKATGDAKAIKELDEVMSPPADRQWGSRGR